MSSEQKNISKPEAVITTQDLWRTYRAGTHQEVHALRGVNFSVQAGEFLALKGRSGSGKTTLLNCIGGLDRPSQGSVQVFGIELKTLSDRQLTRFYRQNVAFIFQAFGLSPIYSATENVEIVMQIAGKRRKERRERALYCLERVGLTKWKDHRTFELSGGQQQRLAIARAMANNPRLILADEPTGKLDTTTAREIFSLFQEIIAEDQVTVLMAAHDPLVDEYVDSVFQLRDGQLLSNGQAQPEKQSSPES